MPILDHSVVGAQVWAFETLLHDAVLKVSKTDAECPPATPQCVGSWTRLQLQNAPSLSELRGLEAMVRLRIPLGLLLRSTLAYTWGEGPRVGGLGYGTTGVILGERVPLSRVPPLHGSAELIGTPGFAVVDLRSSFRVHDRVQLGGVLENVGNVAYRYHGSSVNGPGRGFMLSMKID